MADPIKRALLKYFPFAPAILLAVLLPRYWVDVPQYDEWDSVTLFEHLSQGSLTISLLFKQVNEYRQFFPNVIFVALGKLTHWDLRYEMILIFVAVAVISLNVRRLAALTTQASEIQFAILFLAGNLVIFSLTQYENWFQAQQLVYYMPILCVTTCVIVARTKLGTGAKFFICAALSFISMFSSANGVTCWIVVLPLLFFTEWPRNRRLVIGLSAGWVTACALCVALYLYGYEKPWWTPSPTTGLHHPWRAFIYFVGFMGGPLGLERVKLSIAAGAAMLFGFAAACAYLIKHRRDRSLIERTIGWLVIGSYSLLTGVLTTVGRVGLASSPSQVPRYLGFSAYLLLALIFLAYIIGQDMQQRRGRTHGMPPLAFATILVLISYQPFMLALSYRQMDAWQTRLLQAKASILLINQFPDTRLTKILYPNVQFLAEKANALDGLGLLRPSLIKTKRLNELRGPTGGYYGDLLELVKTQEGFTASGSCLVQEPPVSDATRVPDAVILAYDIGNNDPIAFAMTHPVKRPASIMQGVAKTGSWTIRFAPEQLPQSPVTITAWAFDAATGKAFPLKGNEQISNAP
jgi:hypothetical protein